MKEIKTFYNHPTQVKIKAFFDDGCPSLGGIAYKDVIICGCCGTAFSIPEFIEEAKEENIPLEDLIVPYDSWVDISEEIQGD